LLSVRNIIDTPTFIELVINVTMKLNKLDMTQEYLMKALTNNSENLNYFLGYFNMKEGLSMKNFNDLFSLNNDVSSKLLDCLSNELKPILKSRVLSRLELVLSQGDQFKKVFNAYFLNNIKQNIPSIFTGVKFIYIYQKDKIEIIENIIAAHLKSIDTNKHLDIDLCNGEKLDISPNIIWVQYYAACHYDFTRELEKALGLINKAIDSTPTVAEFYMQKSKILKHAGLSKAAITCYDKARKLDLGDRYLNAKLAKAQVRNNDIENSLETMKEFIRDPLADENIEHTQCMWYESECGYAYLARGEILKGHRLFKSMFQHFNTLIEDQFDFYNYCLRRFMVNDFARTIEYMDKILDNKYIYKALEAFEMILTYIKGHKSANEQVSA
jgi:tetratricopeptide (TPR) repeat protein